MVYLIIFKWYPDLLYEINPDLSSDHLPDYLHINYQSNCSALCRLVLHDYVSSLHLKKLKTILEKFKRIYN